MPLMFPPTIRVTARAVAVVGACVVAVISAAAVQHIVVLDVPLHPRMFVVPALVGGTFGGLIVWSLGLLETNRTYARELEARAQEILDINRDLEARIAQGTQELAQRQEELLQSQKLEVIGHLSGGLAHDLNNLLTVVLANASMLQAEGRDAEQQQLAAEIVEACAKGTDLTQQLLATARARDAEPSSLSLAEAVDCLAPLLRRALGAGIDIHVAHEPAPEVMAVPSQVDQVVLNLVLNARDAMPDGGRIELHTHPCVKGGVSGACIAVRDTGTGIPSAVIPRLFEPFFTTKGKGTGLGLSTVRRVVQEWGGRVGFDTSSAGTTFEVWVPTVTPVAAAPMAAPRHATDQPVVLLVEDEEPVRALFVRILAEEALELHTVESPAEALERAGALERIDLLISDIELHDDTGHRLWAELAAMHPGLAVVFTTEDGAEVPGARHLPKPFDAAALRLAVREAAGSSV